MGSLESSFRTELASDQMPTIRNSKHQAKTFYQTQPAEEKRSRKRI